MPQQTKFKVGDLVSYDGSDEAFITFICTSYIVVCVRQWEDKNARHGVRQVNILAYPHEWKHIIPRNTNGTFQKSSIHSTQA